MIDAEYQNEWNNLVKTFEGYDIYYYNEYVQSLLKCNEARGILFFFQGKKMRMCYPMLVFDIEKNNHFTGLIPSDMFFDMETPYGYGGPLIDGYSEEDLAIFKKELHEWCTEHKIISQFIRFNPVLDNVKDTECFFDEVRYMHHTISMNTESKAIIIENMDSKSRNMVRKAKKNGISIAIDNRLEGLEDFKTIYKQTMDYHNAEDKYYFSDSYYTYLKKEFADHTILFKALCEKKTVAASLFFFNDSYMHYHLSGSLLEYRRQAPSNLLLYTAACWAAENGIKELHLGGGMKEDDSLFGFKKRFNKNGYHDFWIGKTIFLPDDYNRMIETRYNNDADFLRNNSRMIQYR